MRLSKINLDWSESDQLPPKLAAVFLGGKVKPLSQSTLALWRNLKIGPKYVRIGKSIRYPVSELIAFQNSMTDSFGLNGHDNE